MSFWMLYGQCDVYIIMFVRGFVQPSSKRRHVHIHYSVTYSDRVFDATLYLYI